MPELVAAVLRVDPQGGQDEQVAAEFHAGFLHEVRPLGGEHLRDVGQLLVDRVQSVEQVNQARVRHDREPRVPDMDFLTVPDVDPCVVFLQTVPSTATDQFIG